MKLKGMDDNEEPDEHDQQAPVDLLVNPLGFDAAQ